MTKRRAALMNDQSLLQQASAETWPALKLKIDTDLDDSKSYMRTASARVTTVRH